MSESTVTTSAGPARPTPPHKHDSRRLDGWLDNICMFCGKEGWWRKGEQVDPLAHFDRKVHPSGKILLREQPQ